MILLSIHQNQKTMKDKLSGLVIIALVGTLFFQRQCSSHSDDTPKSDTTVVRDTAWFKHDSLIVREVPVLHEIEVPVASKPEYLADTNYPALKAQYDALVKLFILKRVYTDSVQIDDFGYLAVTDTVQENKLLKRKYRHNYSIPVVTEKTTINNYAKPKRQLYVGGGININNTLGITGAKAGFMYKTKKDQLYGISTQVNTLGQVSYGVESYWKINLNKKK